MIRLIFFGIIFILAIACSQTEEVKPDPPVPVQMVLRSMGDDTLNIERGIDAAENLGDTTNAIQVMWYTHPNQNKLSQFNVYRSEHESGLVNYNLIASKVVGQSAQTDTVFNDAQDLELNRRYFYFVRAVDEDGQESENSDTLSYMLLDKVGQLFLNGNSSEITEPILDFTWQYPYPSLQPDYYYMRVELKITEDFHPLVYFKRVQSNYGDGLQSFHIEGDWLKTVFKNGNYRWRVDCEGSEENIIEQRFSGSESDWSDFAVNWE